MDLEDERPTEIVHRDDLWSAADVAEIVEVLPAVAVSHDRPAAVRRPSSTQETRMSAEDPRELARRLAEEAKRRLSGATPAAPAPRDLPAFEDDDGGDFVPDDPPEPEIVIAQTAPAAERAQATSAQTMSALDALNAARARERVGGGAAPSLPPQTAPAPAPRAAAAGPTGGVAGVVAEAFPGSTLQTTQPVTNAEVFRAVWRAHRNRAIHARDLALLASASVLLDAVDRVPRGSLVACSVQSGADRYAVWVDADRNALLAIASPPEVFLVG